MVKYQYIFGLVNIKSFLFPKVCTNFILLLFFSLVDGGGRNRGSKVAILGWNIIKLQFLYSLNPHFKFAPILVFNI